MHNNQLVHELDAIIGRFAEPDSMLRQGRGAEAIPLLKQEIAALRKLLNELQQRLASNSVADLVKVLLARETANLGCAYYQRWHGTSQDADMKQCITECHEAMKVDPKCVEAMALLGSALDDLKQHEEAKSWFTRAVQIKPDFADAWANLGMMHHQEGRLDDAKPCYEKAVEVEPLHAGAWNNLGEIYREWNLPKESADCYRRALAAQPNHRQAASNLERIESSLRQLPRDLGPRQERKDLDWFSNLIEGTFAALDRGGLDADQALTLFLTDDAKSQKGMQIVEGLMRLGKMFPGPVRNAADRVARSPRLRQRELFIYALLGAFLQEPKQTCVAMEKLGENDHPWVRYAVAESLLFAHVRSNVSTNTTVETALQISLELLSSSDEAVRNKIFTGLRAFWMGGSRASLEQHSPKAQSLLRQLDGHCS